MFDLGWSEMLLIGVVALIVVGPKELPNLFRQVGVFMGKARGIAREFSRAMEAAADESGMKEIDRTIRAAANPVKFGTSALRDAATGKPATAATAKVPTAGTPLDPGAPITPGAPVASAVTGAVDTAPGSTAPGSAAAVHGAATMGVAAQRAREREERLAAAAARQAATSPVATPVAVAPAAASGDLPPTPNPDGTA
ncbi:Sec-independent protein translocase protein TatB [Rubellimicrobium roseum]|uniref:Twin-arginine translocase subunit TatB n=1 Tax=Rubellimicrobium roseum TaxID=687525 RepID=A0A5C4NIJ4_9RHOB|nr:Sec-independent protein translocase protein TatB [Rubellimicrobium roseum]TNC73760.1 twin-arginine translocase subunit TatB [Rubellimicrobium roseum]